MRKTRSLLTNALIAAGLGLAASAASATDLAPQSYMLQATVQNSCALQGYDEDMGTQSMGGYTSGGPVFGLQVQCNNDTAWSLAPDDGQNFGLASGWPTDRALSDGAGHYIAYRLYTDSGMATQWSTTNPISGTGNGLWQDASPTADFPEGYQSFAVAAGVYQDTVAVTLTYN